MGAPRNAKNRLLALAALLAFLILSGGYCYARSPWWDEGLFADVALNFRNLGHLGSPTLDPDGFLHFPAVHQYTYWQFPLYLLSVGTWLRFVPPTMEWIRYFSVVFGCLYIVAWFLFVRAITRNENLSLLVGAAVALDYACVSAASNGRMDMMCAALGQAALAAYAGLRSRNWNRAVMVAAVFSAAALFCHPMGVIPNLGLALLIVMDRHRIRWPGLLAAASPFLLGSVLLLRYVLQAPGIYLVQSRSASVARFSTVGEILRNLSSDWYHRYFLYYFASLSGFEKLKSLCLLFGLGGVAGLLLDRRLRALPIARILFIFAALSYFGLVVLDNQDIPVYFVYATPVFSACGAVWTYYSWKRRGFRRVLASILFSSAILATAAGFTYKIHQNEYRTLYLPVIATLRRVVPRGGVVMGGSELGFALGFGPPLDDDRYLGFSSGIQPYAYVEDRYYGNSRRMPWIWSRRQLASNFHLVFVNRLYKVYLRNDVGPQHTVSARAR